MKSKPSFSLTRDSDAKHRGFEFNDNYEPPNEDVLNWTKMRHIQAARALAAEAKYIRSKALTQILQVQFEEVRSHVLVQLDNVKTSRDESLHQLKQKSHSVHSLRRWHDSELKLDNSAEIFYKDLIDYHQELQRSEESMRRAAAENFSLSRRLTKFDEILKVMNDEK